MISIDSRPWYKLFEKEINKEIIQSPYRIPSHYHRFVTNNLFYFVFAYIDLDKKLIQKNGCIVGKYSNLICSITSQSPILSNINNVFPNSNYHIIQILSKYLFLDSLNNL